MFRTKSLFIVAALLMIIAPAGQADETDPVVSDASVRLHEFEIVTRISKELVVDLSRQVVELTVPIQTSVEGFPLRGQATGKGITHVELDSSDERAEFVISVPGTAVGNLRSDVGPAVVQLTSRAQFSAQKRVRFDGMDFHAEPASTETQNCTTVDRICAKRKGPLGRVIERVGRCIANKNLPDVNALAEQVTEEMLTKTFDDTAVELIDELNRSSRFDDVVTKHFPETKSWKYRLATRPDFLLAGLGPSTASFPDFLLDENTRPEAHMELWLRLTPGQAAMLELIGELDITYDLLRDLLPKSESQQLLEDVKVVRRGEWTVIKAGLPKSQQN